MMNSLFLPLTKQTQRRHLKLGLMAGGWCMLAAACRLPPAACGLPPAACRLPPAACRLPPAACRLPPASNACVHVSHHTTTARACQPTFSRHRHHHHHHQPSPLTHACMSANFLTAAELEKSSVSQGAGGADGAGGRGESPYANIYKQAEDENPGT
jgi:hypothetical protein